MQEYQSFRIGSDGNLQGVGLFVNAEPKTGHLVNSHQFPVEWILLTAKLFAF